MGNETISQKRRYTTAKIIVVNLLFVFLCMLVAFILTNLLFQSVVIDGTSMLNTLEDNDSVVVYKLGKYERGDIVVFESPLSYLETEEKYWVKRIIGLPGDTVEVVYNRDINKYETYVNNILFDEPYLASENQGGSTSEKTTVKEGEFFFMGDNRRNSTDSRKNELVGLLDNIIGRVIVSYVIGRRDGKFRFELDFIKRGK
ncbi:MAG: signal peptidase I [Christensenellaceae bacterium]|jgi:signal peptidase I|nr:signal peptidase I [Christensenellaceae bacterium]